MKVTRIPIGDLPTIATHADFLTTFFWVRGGWLFEYLKYNLLKRDRTDRSFLGLNEKAFSGTCIAVVHFSYACHPVMTTGSTNYTPPF